MTTTNGNTSSRPVKLLIVDDEPDLEALIVQKFRKQIRDGRFQFRFASDGTEALEQLEADREIELILTDINMPRMDGLTLLTKLREMNHPVLKAVIVSAYGDMDNIRVAMNRGAFDFLTKPIDLRDLETTVEKALRELFALKESLEARARLHAIEHELDIARKIQQGIVPTIFPAFPGHDEFEVYGKMVAARHVGGDFYDFFLLDDHRLGFVIGDVSGKGVPAAIMMAVSRTLLRAVAQQVGSAGECLSRVNNILRNDNDENLFVTVFYGVLDIATGRLEYSNGGHNPPYVVSKGGELRAMGGASGIVLGVIEGGPYSSETISLDHGDVVFLFTDGVTEAMNAEEEFFDDERLVAILQGHRGEALSELLAKVYCEVEAFAGGAPQSDDVTVLAVRYR